MIDKSPRMDSFEYAKKIRTAHESAEVTVEVDTVLSVRITRERMEFTYTGSLGSVTFTANFCFVKSGFAEPKMYFTCPACKMRCRFLYCKRYRGQIVFICRTCAGIPYLSEQYPSWYLAGKRVIEQLRIMGVHETDLERGAYRTPPRQPRQHEKTYERELEKLRNLQLAYRRKFDKALLAFPEAEEAGLLPYDD